MQTAGEQDHLLLLNQMTRSPSLRIDSGHHWEGAVELAELDLDGSQCGRSSTLELPYTGIRAKLAEVWAPAFKPSGLAS